MSGNINWNSFGQWRGLGAQVPQQRMQQRKPAGTSSEIGSVNSTPANNPSSTASETISTMRTGMGLYERFAPKPVNSGNNVQTAAESAADRSGGINTGNNVTNPNQYSSDDPRVLQGIVTEQQMSKDLLGNLASHAKKLAGDTANNLDAPKGEDLSVDIKNGNPLYNYSREGDKLVGTQKTYVGDDGPAEWGGQTWTVPDTWESIRSVALPVAAYAAGYNTMDSRDRWLQGGRTLQQIFQGFAGRYEGADGVLHPNKTVLDNYYISNFVDLADMTTHWSDRNAYQNAVTGLNAAVNFIDNFGLADVIGGTDALLAARDGLSLLNFGSSLYYLANDWDKMSSGEKVAAVTQTILAGCNAYDAGTGIINAFSAATTAAADGVATGAVGTAANGGLMLANGSTTAPVVGTAANGGQLLADGSVIGGASGGAAGGSSAISSTIGTIGATASAVLGAYSMYQGINTFDKMYGQGNAAARASLAGAGAGIVSGAMMVGSLSNALITGASIGSAIPGIGTLIGATVGAVAGCAMGCVNAGKSSQQASRDNWRQAYGNAGVFASTNNGSYAMQLADGRYYDVGVDGKDGYATMINGERKTWADPSKLENVSADRSMQPYDVDYTNNLDFMGNVMLTGMLLPIGGTIAAINSREVRQMIGYMTNGVTSNCGREFTRDNWNIMVDNIRALYAKTGITEKSNMINCLADAYFDGKLSKDDYQSGLMSASLIYDDNGFEQAENTLNQLGRETPVEASNVTTDNGGNE